MKPLHAYKKTDIDELGWYFPKTLKMIKDLLPKGKCQAAQGLPKSFLVARRTTTTACQCLLQPHLLRSAAGRNAWPDSHLREHRRTWKLGFKKHECLGMCIKLRSTEAKDDTYFATCQLGPPEPQRCAGASTH